jgi:hypothetical protein
VPGSPGLQAISFNTSCEIEIAPKRHANRGPTALNAAAIVNLAPSRAILRARRAPAG